MQMLDAIDRKFAALATDNAPGQEVRQVAADLTGKMIGEKFDGRLVDFSHGDVDAFLPAPSSFGAFEQGVRDGGKQAYTEYRGSRDIREVVAERLTAFTGVPISGDRQVILTPGTQGALFLAVASTVAAGDKVAIVQPDYFANRKLVQFFGGEIVPVQLGYLDEDELKGLDLAALEAAFEAGARLFIFSNPNNPTGAVYSADEIEQIAALAKRFGATVIADQLYSRLLYSGNTYTHLRAKAGDDNLVTIMGPSKTESLSGYRLGVAFGSEKIIQRMEKLQAIVSLRAPGYNQAVLHTWFAEPAGWMEERIRLHQAIRDDLVTTFRSANLPVAIPKAGSYLFPKLPELRVAPQEFVALLRQQANVIVTPGSEFSPRTLTSVRLNYSQDHAAAVAAAKRIVSMVETYAR
jgi:aspartate/methionine/tyrosine aminotransferase